MNALKRPKFSIYIAMSIDGYIAREDGDVDWLQKGRIPGEDYGAAKFMETVDVLVMGRNTYEKVLTFDEWPYQGKRVIVLSKTLTSVKNDATLFKGNIKQLIDKLYDEGVKHVYIDGGMTASQFLNERLVDQMILSVIPVILGAGIPLFSHINTEIDCHLKSSQSYSCGLIQLIYGFS
jgi:dihydrofolate reductase